MPRISKLPNHVVAQWATQHVAEHTKDFTHALAENFGVTRSAAATAVKILERDGYVIRSGGKTRPTFSPGPSTWIERSYTLPGLDESALWESDFSPWIHASDNVKNILHYGFTEMVNNANDHSGGKRVQVGFQGSATVYCLTVFDDGIGVFEKIATALNLPDMRLALLELSKGKFTSDKTQHSGEGIFFTSRMFDAFYLDANHLVYSKLNTRSTDERLDTNDFQLVDESGQPIGTGVMMFIAPESQRTTREVFSRYTPDVPDDFSFSKTTIPVKLASIGNENLLSRSQAKRLVSRIDQFKIVELDFSEVSEIGQAFADEVFRVFSNAHPEVRLIPINANAYVQGMIKRVKG